MRLFQASALALAAFTAPAMATTTLTFGTTDIDRLDLNGPIVEGDFTYSATGEGWELQSLFANPGTGLATFFNTQGSMVGDTVSISRTDGGVFAFDGLDYESLSSVGDEVEIVGSLSGSIVGSLDLMNGVSAFSTVASSFSGAIDLLEITVTFAGSSTMIFDNIVLSEATAGPAPVPLPASGLLLVGGIAAFGGLRRRKG